MPNTPNGCYRILFIRDKFLIGCGSPFHEQLEKVFCREFRSADAESSQRSVLV